MVRRLRVVVQARLSSSRLPAKALLPFGGVPLAALVAKRVARGGHEVVLATSDDLSDDLLAAEMERHGVSVVRGSLDDVLGRFVQATADLSDDDLCVRMTGDNPGPDGDFVSVLAELRDQGNFGYLGYGGNQVGLPYGMAAEIFTVGALRAADRAAHPGPDREHVTTLVRAAHKPDVVPDFPGLTQDFGPLRATVDSFDDYTRMAEVFAGTDPIALPWTQVMERLTARPDAPIARVSGLVLGTVQLGLDYGVANKSGMPSATEAKQIIHRAIEHGVTQIDTARAYGRSEARIGAALSDGWQGRAQVLTKLAPNIDGRDGVRASVFASAHALRMKHLPMVMVHRTAHLGDPEIRDALLELRDESVIGALGASVQNPDEFRTVMDDDAVTHIQAPCNLLDWRWNGVERRKNVTVHARSVYLQGLLVPSRSELWPKIDGVDPRQIKSTLADLAHELGRLNFRDLCLAWLRAQPWIDGVVVGVEAIELLYDNISMFGDPPLTLDQARTVSAALPKVPEQLLDPARWP